MAPKLKTVDPTRPPGVFVRAYAAFAAGRVARFISRHVNWKLDPLLLRITRGRLATTLVFPDRGARDPRGQERRDADATRSSTSTTATVSRSPRRTRATRGIQAWYHNLRADPDVIFGGIPMRATVVDDPTERERLWVLATGSSPPSRATDATPPRRTERSRSSS